MHLFSASSPSEFDDASSIDKPQHLNCAGLLLDLGRRRGLVGEVDIGLSPLEFAMVHLLASNRGVAMSKEAISTGLPVQVDPRMVDVYVSRARTKMAAFGLDEPIKTVWGRGYMVDDLDDDTLDQAPIEPPASCDLDATLAPA